jgi:hypothetical protein
MGSHCDCLQKTTIYIKTKQINLDNTSTPNNTAFLNYDINFSESSYVATIKQSNINEESFEEILLNEINLARTYPRQYANKLKSMLNNIQIENQTCILQYKDEKIILQKGTQVILDAIKILNSMQPISKLVYNDTLKINCENLKLQTKGSNRINNKLFNKALQQVMLDKRNELLKKYPNCLFTLDVFKDPVISAMFQIIDEAFNQTRRNIILDPKFTQFGVGYFYDNNNQFMAVCSFV